MSQRQFHLRFRGRITGPFSMAELVAMAKSGKAGRMHEYSVDQGNWTSVRNLLESAPTDHSEPHRLGASDKEPLNQVKSHTRPVAPAANAKSKVPVPMQAPELNKRVPESVIITVASRKQSHWKLLLTSFVVVVVLTCMAILFWPRDHWEENNRNRIAAARSQIDGLADKNSWLDVQEQAESLLKECSGKTLKSYYVRQDLDAIRERLSEATSAIDAAGYSPVLEKRNQSLRLIHDHNPDAAEQLINEAVVSAVNIAKTDSSADRLVQLCRSAQAQIAAQARSLREEARKQEEIRQNKLAEERVRLAEQQRRDEEARRQAEEAKRQLAEEKRRLAAAMIRRSPEFVALQAKADTIVQNLRLSMISEDSAWRGINRRTHAARDLLAIYVKLEGMTHGVDVVDAVDNEISSSDIGLIAEDSALRAIPKNDASFFHLLGIWAKVLDAANPGANVAFAEIQTHADRLMITEDSAYRASQIMTSAGVDELKDILTRQGFKDDVSRIAKSMELGAAADTTAIQAAMRNAEGIMDLLLLKVAQVKPDDAKTIKASVDLHTITDDSAIRAHGQYKQGVADSLYVLIKAY